MFGGRGRGRGRVLLLSIVIVVVIVVVIVIVIVVVLVVVGVLVVARGDEFCGVKVLATLPTPIGSDRGRLPRSRSRSRLRDVM